MSGISERNPGGAPLSEILERAASLIEPEGAWQQGGYGDGGLPTCIGGAVNLALGRRSWDAPYMDSTVQFLNGFVGGVAHFNDAPGRTQSEVVAKLREAASKARSEQS